MWVMNLKKILIMNLCVLVLFSSSCDVINGTSSTLDSRDYDEVSNLTINANQMFEITANLYYVYFFSINCSHCISLKDYVIDFAIKYPETFYFVDENTTDSIPTTINMELNIGASKFADIYLRGYPTLMKIDNHIVSAIYTGVAQIRATLSLS